MAVREFWLKLFLRGESPSDAICVQVEEADTTISDLKRRFLQEIREILPGQTALPWISLTLPPSPFSDGLDPVQTLDSSQELSELPEGAGSKKWQMHAEVRLLGDMGPPVDRTAQPQVRATRGSEGRTLYERGLAGRDEPDHIKNALDFKELYPGGKLPQGGKLDFSLVTFLKLLLTFGFIGCLMMVTVYFLENLPSILEKRSGTSHSEL